MHDRAYALISLTFLITLGATIVAAALWLTDPGTQRLPYVLTTDAGVDGLDNSSRLYYRGVAAGRVETVGIDPQGRVRIRIRIDPGIPITHGTYATVAPQGLTGVSHLALDDDGSNPRPLETSPEEPASIPMQRGLLDRVTQKGDEVVAELQELVARVNRLLSDDNLTRVDAILSNVELASADAVEFQREVTGLLAKLAPLVDEARSTLGRIDRSTEDLSADARQALRRIDGTAAALGEIPAPLAALIAELGEVTRTAGRFGSQLDQDVAPQINRTLDQLTRTAEDLSRTARELERRPQSLIHGRPTGSPGPGERGYRQPTGN